MPSAISCIVAIFRLTGSKSPAMNKRGKSASKTPMIPGFLFVFFGTSREWKIPPFGKSLKNSVGITIRVTLSTIWPFMALDLLV